MLPQYNYKNLFLNNLTFKADGRNLLQRMRQHAGDFINDYGYEIPVHVLAEKMGELCQVYTQHAYMRPLCCVTILFSIDDENGPQIFKVDPAGHYMGYKATATGEKEQSANNNLEREIKKKNKLSVDETIKTAIKTLQNVKYFYLFYFIFLRLCPLNLEKLI